MNRIVAKPESLATAQEIADEAVTLVRDNHRRAAAEGRRLEGTNSSQNAYQPAGENRGRTLLLIFTDDSRSDAGGCWTRQMRARIPDVKTIYIDPRNAAAWAQPVMDAVEQAQTVIAAVYLSPQGGAPANMAASCQLARRRLLQNVVQTAASKTVVVAMGNPYIAAQMPRGAKLPVHVLGCAGLRAERGEGNVWRDPDVRPTAGDDSNVATAAPDCGLTRFQRRTTMNNTHL